jgi:hypothetical protein
MFKRFKISKNGEGPTENPLNKFSGKINAVQHRWADRLQEKSERLSSTGKRVFLSLFLLIFGGGSIFIAWQAMVFTRLPVAPAINRITPSSTEGAATLKAPFPDEPFVPAREHQAILLFRHYLDSLGQTEKGQLIRDSILKQRPGLVDSLDMLERVYLMQSKK